MGRGLKNILCVNGGSTSVKFAIYQADGGDLIFRNKGNVEGAGLRDAATSLFDRLQREVGEEGFSVIGHRVVHGLQHREPALIDDGLLDELQRISGYDPDHLPGEIGLIKLFRERDAGLRQVACFDTAFHTTLPRVARLLPLPRRYDEAGLQRYGFHGLSYSYIAEKLLAVAGREVALGRVIVAHLGGGASLAALKEGRSVDTTMGFTPTGGIMMGTRSGDLDPGALWWILKQEGLTAEQFSNLVNRESGLLGVSGLTSDMLDLLGRGEGSDAAAAEAIELFCYQIRKSIGAFAAVLGGVDAVVFTGGIGERSPVIRSRVCSGLEYLGVRLDADANDRNEPFIGGVGERVKVYALPTDEESMIARQALKFIQV